MGKKGVLVSGSVAHRIAKVITANPGIAPEDIRAKLGFKGNDELSDVRKYLKPFGIDVPYIRKGNVKQSSPSYDQLVHELRETIRSPHNISKNHGIKDERLIYRIAARENLRGQIFTQNGKKIFGTMATDRFGLDPERLLIPYETIEAEKQKKVLQRHIGLVKQRVDSFPLPELRDEFGQFALHQLRLGLTKYPRDSDASGLMCSEKHFVMLILVNARRKFTRRRLHGEYPEQLDKMPLTYFFTSEQIDGLITAHYNDIIRTVSQAVGSTGLTRFVNDLAQEGALRAARYLEVYNPKVHGKPLSFMLRIATGTVREFKQILRMEELDYAHYRDYQRLWNAIERNKPTNTNPRKQFSKEF